METIIFTILIVLVFGALAFLIYRVATDKPRPLDPEIEKAIEAFNKIDKENGRQS